MSNTTETLDTIAEVVAKFREMHMTHEVKNHVTGESEAKPLFAMTDVFIPTLLVHPGIRGQFFGINPKANPYKWSPTNQTFMGAELIFADKNNTAVFEPGIPFRVLWTLKSA